MKTLAAVSTLVLGVLAGPSFASAQTAVTIIDDATLLAKGAGALVTLEFTCAEPNMSTSVSLIQRSGNKIATGYGSDGTPNLACTGAPQAVNIVVTTSGNARFKVGPVIAQAFISSCNQDYTVCTYDADTKEIRLHQ